MRLEVLLAMLWAGWEAFALSISHWDLEGGNRTCEEFASCKVMKDVEVGSTMLMNRNCQCDEACPSYGDCCLDSPRFELHQQRRGLATYDCVKLPEYRGVYMVTSCPPDWSGPNVRAACEAKIQNKKDPLAGFPATDNRTGVTYRNLFCAVCHRAEELDVWHPEAECQKFPVDYGLDKDNITDLLYYNEEQQSWGFDMNNTFYNCSVHPYIPVTSNEIVRRCIPNLIKTCAVNWNNAEVRARCDAYTSIVYQGDNAFRNPHCAICNNVPLHSQSCKPGMYSRTLNPSALSILFDLSSGPPGMEQPCKDDQLYDPFFKRCRSVLVEFQEQQNPISQPTIQQIYNITSEPAPIEKCSKFLLEKDDFIVVNSTVYVYRYRKRFKEGEFYIRKDGKLEICSDIGVVYVDKFDKYMGYVTLVGLGVSIVFIFLHLIAFCLVEELRNLSGKNLASLCVALLIAYISFMTGQILRGSSCLVIAIITFYAFLASFVWMLTMAFDVWRTLRLATAELRVSAGKQWRKFILYSVWSWTMPATIVAMALWAELSPCVGADWKPNFGTTSSCWFGHSKPLLIFFAVPLAVVMILNIAFFTSSAQMVYSSSSTTRFMASSSTQRDFRLYLRLAIVMGLTWIMGLLAGSLDIDLLWYLFVLLNTLQGFFIFLAFTCNDKVIRGLALYRNSKPEVIPRSFSWSTDSITRKSNVESEKTMDTLY